jgi:hypothetical protein
LFALGWALTGCNICWPESAACCGLMMMELWH